MDRSIDLVFQKEVEYDGNLLYFIYIIIHIF